VTRQPRRESPQEEINDWYAAKFGAWRGMTLAWAYTFVLGPLWAFFSSDLATAGVVQHVAGLIWFWAYGYIFGCTIGLTVGAFTGYLLYGLLALLVPKITKHAWLVGLAACTGLWLIIHFALRQAILSEPMEPDDFEKYLLTYKILILYPGVIYILSGTLLAQKFYTQNQTTR
jgi:hypothetical protein